MKNGKRIHKVVIKHILDQDPDTSYLEQDEFSTRLQEFENGMFGFIGIRAEAEIGLPSYAASQQLSLLQTITSGGLWGIESDSGKDYLAEIEADELSELREQLTAIGFSKRAIATAFKNVERAEE